MTSDTRACSGRYGAPASAWTAQPWMSGHAGRRAAQRNLAMDEVRYVMTYGFEYHRTGVAFVVLRRCDIPREDLRLPWVTRLAGAVALVSSDGEVITLYRNGLATSTIRRKMKYRLPWKAARSHRVADTAGEEWLDTSEPEAPLGA